MREVNFDGLVGPSHNYAGLSLGNIASATHAGAASSPREAALQGLDKMRRMMALGFAQGLLLPHDRPHAGWLRQLGFGGDDMSVCRAAYDVQPALLRNAFSASSMWTANAATVSPRPDTEDGRSHISVANLSSMPHRSIEAAQTGRQLRLLFAALPGVAVHDPLPACFGDEGAANHMRLCLRHGGPGLEIFVHGAGPVNGFPARQHIGASQALIRRHALAPERAILARQSDAAIAAGAFHNDVVAVANETVLFAHEQAFAEPGTLYARIRQILPEAQIIEVPAALVSLDEAIRSYLFNSQLVTLDDGGMLLLLPDEAREVPSVARWLAAMVESNGPIRRVEFMPLRESMRNGGGPACLRLRVVLDEGEVAALDQRFMLNPAKCDALAALIAQYWPERIAPEDIGNPDLWRQCWSARAALLDMLGFAPGEL
ncbi:N-succinylarginine dihydrolase [Novosphingobium sp. KACC 22771]|uniref:N-succinylarginine dihydrolase n=1 Tax=Novosphingobium sp. KACC 22771 TaxID=3025670 RepID=UPI0023665A77|nr:N-succinylarginine dihydrolase [Novosphingobium sp. KACC 22771]WDF74457.1 N-succinylarginine dihydrolase [Novosphingobium sp. KACC 22771]